MSTPVSQEFSVEKLNRIFAGREVQITHTGNRALGSGAGTCLTFHKTETGVDIELTDQSRWGFNPDALTERSVEGNVGRWIMGRRKVQLV